MKYLLISGLILCVVVFSCSLGFAETPEGSTIEQNDFSDYSVNFQTGNSQNDGQSPVVPTSIDGTAKNIEWIRKYIDKGEYNKAIDKLKSLYVLEPNNKEYTKLLGSVYNVNRKYEDAIYYFNEALRVDPNDDEALKGKSESLEKQKLKADKCNGITRNMCCGYMCIDKDGKPKTWGRVDDEIHKLCCSPLDLYIRKDDCSEMPGYIGSTTTKPSTSGDVPGFITYNENYSCNPDSPDFWPELCDEDIPIAALSEPLGKEIPPITL